MRKSTDVNFRSEEILASHILTAIMGSPLSYEAEMAGFRDGENCTKY